jgi:hypothetical protein
MCDRGQFEPPSSKFWYLGGRGSRQQFPFFLPIFSCSKTCVCFGLVDMSEYYDVSPEDHAEFLATRWMSVKQLEQAGE